MRQLALVYSWLIALAIAGSNGLGTTACWGQSPPEAVVGEPEPLARGPIHEAFAEPVVFDPQPGLVVPKAPPALVEELPPDERPEGEEVVWVPGYWGWDEDRSDFVWISGFWRVLPPGRQWVPGYWTEVSSGGFQWVSGYWAPITSRTVEYLPAPPTSLEAGPSTLPPESDSVWSPGCWRWSETRYVWRAGTWLTPRSNWIWTPSHYVWTPRGFVYVDGYWDYALANRGILYAPVYLPPPVVTTVGYRYQPRLVIDVGILTSHFFVRPQTCHYYYGDYYAPNYLRSGVYPWFAFHTGRHGYDPIYAHYRRTHSPDWDDQIRADYLHRREHVSSRPPHTLAGLGGPPLGTPPRDGHGPLRQGWDERSLVKPPAALTTRPHGIPSLERMDPGRREIDVRSAEAFRRSAEARSLHERPTPENDRVERGRGIRPETPIVGGQERTPSAEGMAPRSRPTPSFARERPAPTDRVTSARPPLTPNPTPPTIDRPTGDRPTGDRSTLSHTGRERLNAEPQRPEPSMAGRTIFGRGGPDRGGPDRGRPTRDLSHPPTARSSPPVHSPPVASVVSPPVPQPSAPHSAPPAPPSATSRPRLPLASDAGRTAPRLESRPPPVRASHGPPAEARRFEPRGPAGAAARPTEPREKGPAGRHGRRE